MKLMVLDGNSIINRAYYGVRFLSAPDGTPTNAVFGFLNILLKLISDDEPDGLCVTFDLKAPTFRHRKYDGYKAQRKPMPEELAVQVPLLKDVLDAMNIPRYELEGYEADDLLGTIAGKCEAAGWDCLIVTGDKDSFQLITERTHVKHVKTVKGRTETNEYTPERFTEEYGFTPPKMVDLKALMGDSSDNIPGVPGVGEKTAMDLVRKYGTVQELYGALETLEIRDSLKNKLIAGRDSAEMSYDLARIRCDAPIQFSPEGNRRKPVNNDETVELFRRLGFHKLMERFSLTEPTEKTIQNAPEKTFEGTCTSTVLISETEVAAAVTVLRESECAYYWCEAPFDTVAIHIDRGDNAEGYYLSRDRYGDDYDEALRALFAPEILKAGHHIKPLQRVLLERGVEPEGWVFDTALAAYLLDATAGNYDIDRISMRYCGFVPHRAENEENEQLSLLEPDRQDLAARMGEQLSLAATVDCLREVLAKQLAEQGMTELYEQVELPLCPVLAKMETAGFLVDQDALIAFGEVLTKDAEKIQQTVYELAGETFNLNSPKQLGTILFEKLMLPAPKKTKTGWSTNVDVLESLRNKHPIIQQILDYRQLTKLKSTYVDGLLRVIGEDGRIHTNFQMTVTATGRLSSTEPNLQNIPVRRELGGEIRKMFTAAEGNILVDADYSQIELRLLAHISDDETMRNAFREGEDIHRVTASQVFDTPMDEVTPLQRSRAKAVNFGIVYGISPFSLSQDVDVTVSEAKRYIESYLSNYHGVRDYMKRVVEQAKVDGYVSTLYGRRRALPELKSSNYNIRSFGERVALNMPVQGTAADVMKIAMIRVHNRLQAENRQARLILQIHDELIVECPAEEREAVEQILREEMMNAAALSVPLIAEAGAGRTWYEAKES